MTVQVSDPPDGERLGSPGDGRPGVAAASPPKAAGGPERVAGSTRFLTAIVGDNPRRLIWVITVQVANAFTQGIGILLLVTLLAVAGVSGSGTAGTTEGLVGLARRLFADLGLPLRLGTMLVAYVVMVSLAAGLTAYQTVLCVRYRLEFVDGLRRRLYRSIAAAEWRHLLGLRQSDLMTALTVDVNWVAQGTQAALSLATAAALVATQLAVAVRISAAVTALAVLTGAALCIVVWPLVVRSRRLGRELVGRNRAVLASVTGFLDGLKLAKAHGRVASHIESFDTSIAGTRRSQVDFVVASAAATAVQLSVTAVVLAVLVGVAVDRYHLALAELLVLAFIFTRLVPQITQAQSNVHALAQTLPAFTEIDSLIATCDQAAEESHGRRSPLGALRLAEGLTFDRVSFAYLALDGQSVDVLRDVTLVLPARSTTALVGPSGAGKTTIADLCVGLLQPTTGQVAIDGLPLTGERTESWRESVAMVPQDPFLFHDTIRANLVWARPDAPESDLLDALATASALEFVLRLPKGLDTVVGDRGARLSGGERQRIALARALMRRPQLLVLDEATNSLDADNESAILAALGRLHGHTTILVISHQQSAVCGADRVITISDGRVERSGST